MNVKLLLDENLSPKVAEILCKEDCVDACHVRDRGLLAATDGEVLERAYAEDRIVVTCNVGDFVKLAHARDLHPGIILLEDGGMQTSHPLETTNLWPGSSPTSLLFRERAVLLQVPPQKHLGISGLLRGPQA